MCFSAEASFIVSSTILIAGIVAVRKVPAKQQIIFAAIPIIFAVQQLAEGFLWIALKRGALLEWKDFLTYFFLIFAQVIWPTWVPLAFFLAEQNVKRKKILFGLTGMGILVSIFLMYCLTVYPVEARVTSHHVFYEVNFPDFAQAGSVFYFIVTIFPAFISSLKWTWILGLLNFMSFIVSKLFFHDHVISVWCFLAAAISVMIVFIVYKNSGKPGLRLR